MILQRLLMALLACCFIGACTSAPQAPLSIDEQQHQQKLTEFDHWRIKGRLGFKSPQEKFSANLNWVQQQEHYDLKLTTLLGITLMEMSGRPGYAMLNADDQEFQDTDASLLIWRITGWNIPVSQLPLWIKGQFSPQDDVLTDENGFPTLLKPQCVGCEDWAIHLQKYKPVDGTWLPHDVKLVNQASPDNQIKIRINSWEAR